MVADGPAEAVSRPAEAGSGLRMEFMAVSVNFGACASDCRRGGAPEYGGKDGKQRVKDSRPPPGPSSDSRRGAQIAGSKPTHFGTLPHSAQPMR